MGAASSGAFVRVAGITGRICGMKYKMALLASSYSPNVYDGAIGEYRGILSYWGVEDSGIVTAKNDEQKTDATRAKILEIVKKRALPGYS